MGPAEMAAVMQLCESGLDGAVATVDHQYLGLYPRDRLQRRADLVDMLHLVVENVLMLGAKAPHLGQHRQVAGRAWVGKERDAGHGLVAADRLYGQALRSEGNTSELQSLLRISSAVFCLKKK